MNETDLISGALSRLYDFVRANPWIGLAAIGIWLGMRAIQSDIKYVPTVPARFRIFCLPVFVIASILLAHSEVPTPWFTAIVGSFIASYLAIYAHEAFIKAIRRGKNIPIPFLTIPGAQPSPNAPVTKEAEPDDPPPPAPV